MTGVAVLVGLLEAIIDREADRVERIQGEVDKLSQAIFGARAGRRANPHAAVRCCIRMIGREGELTSRSRETMLTLDRLLDLPRRTSWASAAMRRPLKARVKTASRDVRSLADHIGYLSPRSPSCSTPPSA